MLCPSCRKNSEGVFAICPKCGHLIYEIRLSPTFCYRRNKETTLIIVHLANKGGDPIILESISTLENVLLRFALGDPDHVRAHTARKDGQQIVEHQLDLPLPAEAASLNLHFNARVRGLPVDLTPDGIDFPICPLPRLDMVTRSIQIDPIDKTPPALVFALANANVSKAVITRIQVLGAEIKISEPLTLDGKNPDLRVPVKMSEDLIGAVSGKVEVSLAQLGIQEFDVDVTVLTLPELKTEVQQFTDEGVSFVDVSALTVFNWSVPRRVSRQKTVRLLTSKDDHTTQGISLLPRATPPVELGEMLKAPVRFVEREILLKVNYLENDAKSELAFEIDDNRQPGGKRLSTLNIHLKTFEQQKYSRPVGLDFGTTNSCLSLVIPQERVGSWQTDPGQKILRPLPLERKFEDHDASLMLSSILPERAGKRRVGWEAEQDSNPLQNFKLLIKTNEPLSGFNGQTPEEVISEYMAEMFSRGMMHLEERGVAPSRFERVQLAVPTMFIPAWKQRLVSACKKALAKSAFITNPEVRPIDESMAALRYGLQRVPDLLKEPETMIMVIDFGGGTTDITVVERKRSDKAFLYKVLAWGGDPSFGGSNVDALIKSIIDEILGTPTEMPPGEAQSIKHNLAPGALERHLQKAYQFGIYEKIAVALRKEIHDRINERFDIMLKGVLERVMKSPRYDLPLQVLLAGNASRLHGFADIIRLLIQGQLRDPYKDLGLRYNGVFHADQPKYCVSIGAFMHGLHPQYQGLEDICTFDVLILVQPDIIHDDVVRLDSGSQAYLRVRSRRQPFWGQSLSQDIISDPIHPAALGFQSEEDVDLTIYTQFANEPPAHYNKPFRLSALDRFSNEQPFEVIVTVAGEIQVRWCRV